MTEEKSNKKRKGKVMSIIGKISFIILILSVAGKLLGGYISKNTFSVPKEYTSTVQTGGDIEAKYLAMGKHEVEYVESATMSSLEKFEIHYPKDIASMGQIPVVIFLNGTGVQGAKYPALQEHLASWGFITIANEESNSFYGEAVELSIRFLKLIEQYESSDQPSPLKGHIDFNNIGVTGHSQGGIGVINGITIHPESDMIKAAVILSSTETNAAKALLWDSDSSLIKANTLMIGSTGDTDSKISPLESMQSTFDKINGVDKVMARRNDADHGQMLYYADGYVTAWFMYYLQGENSANAFFGDNAEMKSNSLYQDFMAEKGTN